MFPTASLPNCLANVLAEFVRSKVTALVNVDAWITDPTLAAGLVQRDPGRRSHTVRRVFKAAASLRRTDAQRVWPSRPLQIDTVVMKANVA